MKKIKFKLAKEFFFILFEKGFIKSSQFFKNKR